MATVVVDTKRDASGAISHVPTHYGCCVTWAVVSYRRFDIDAIHMAIVDTETGKRSNFCPWCGRSHTFKRSIA